MNATAPASNSRLLEKLLTGTALTLALSLLMQGFQPAVRSQEVPAVNPSVKAPAIASTTPSQSLQDGVYLYGQSANPDQIGAAYMVFEVTQDKVVGAFYMPNSSFDCFHGSFKADQLALTVKDSYEQTSHPYAIALETSSTTASTQPGAIAGLAGYHPISNVSRNDQRLLSTCKATYRAGL